MQTAEMTRALAHIFTQLFSEGFGSAEEPTESVAGGTRDATGTGMGEGEGINDVSDQIEDESQLLGCAEKVLVSRYQMCIPAQLSHSHIYS